MHALLLAVAVLGMMVFRTDLNGLEIAVLVAAIAAAACFPGLGTGVCRVISSRLAPLARRQSMTVWLMGALAAGTRLAMLPLAPVPQPVVVDEFSHLLLGETLASGRITNPTHPMWAHFETMQVIQKPTYTSMYFPGQGLFLALGQAIAGVPWAGVVLSVALMCMAICWALQGWLPPGWALLGGLIAVARFGLFSYWIDSYWGGALGALGGALVLGAWPRVRRHMSARASVLMALGLVTLAVSRPFEGLLASVPVAGAVLLWWYRLDRARRVAAVRRVVMPVFCILIATGGLLACYNARVTGGPLRVPYSVNQQTYGWPLTLPWFHPRPHTYSSKAMRDYFEWEAMVHRKITDFGGNLLLNVLDGVILWSFFVGPALTAYLIFLPRACRDRRMRLPAAVLAAGLLAVAIEQSRYPHYFAPATAALLILLLQGARHMRAGGARRRPAMAAVLRAVPAVMAVLVCARIFVPALRARHSTLGYYISWCCNKPGNLDRAGILNRLEHTPGDHLVIVRYGPVHTFMYEWVYNEPDIDRARVVWARDLGPGADQELRHYFPNRRVWLLDVEDDFKPPQLVPDPDPKYAGRAAAHGNRPASGG